MGGQTARERKTGTDEGPLSLDQLWVKLRQGARNVAGVSWQVAVTAYLVSASRAGQLPFVEFTPEGFEDVDCRDSSGGSTYLQMKEVGGGAGRMTAADVAGVLAHAADTTRGGTLVLATDGSLGSGLLFTGWDGFLADQGGSPVESVLEHLTSGSQRSKEDAKDLVARARLVSLPWNLRGWTEALVQQATDAHPAVASFVVGRLYEQITAAATEQRHASRSQAAKLLVGDLDAIAADVQSAVDVNGLDEALAAGVCTPADYVHGSHLTLQQFYAGVDGAPAHVAGGLDVLRPREMGEVVDAVSSERYAVLLGPSGSGKSVLLWRAARDALLGARVIRVQRVQSPEDTNLLVRHVRMLRPTPASPVVVAVDNLGRPNTRAWPDAVPRLHELPDVMLIGAVRAEDFHPGIIRGGARVVELRLDQQTALYIADEIGKAGVPVRMAPAEAELRADGLLMEFIALLATGRRLEQVLADQVEALRAPGRELQRTLARLITAAHSTGVAVPAVALPGAMGVLSSPDAVGDALAVLRGEHVLVTDGTVWHGLHELRSQTITRLLHESPPPTQGSTYAEVVGLLPPSSAAWVLRRATEQLGDEIHDVARVLVTSLGRGELTAADAAVLFEGAERADNMLYAKTCLSLVRRHLRPGISIESLALLVYGARNQGIADGATGSGQWDTVMRNLRDIGEELPERTAVVASVIASGLDADRLVDLTLGASLSDAVRLLEALADEVHLPAEAVSYVFHGLRKPATVADADMYARLINRLIKAARLQGADITPVLDTVESRAVSVMSPDPNALRVEIKSDGAIIATLYQPVNPGDGVLTTPPWDTTRPSKASDIEARSLRTGRRLSDACPEAPMVEVVTVTASGRRFVVNDFEPGYRRIGQDVRRQWDRISVRRSVGFQAAVRRLTASTTWTQLIADQVAVATGLLALLEQAPLRLKSTDNANRRSQWLQEAQHVQRQASELASRPTTITHDPNLTNAQADEADRRADPTSEVLSTLADALPRVVEGGPIFGLSSTLREIAEKIREARTASNPRLAGIGEPLPAELSDRLTALADLATAVGHRPQVLHQIRATDLPATSEVAVRSVAADLYAKESALLRQTLSDISDLEIHYLRDPKPFITSIDGKAWFITVPVANWHEAVDALQRLSHDERASFSSNVFLSAVADNRSMPFAVQLIRSDKHPLLPALLQQTRPFIEQTDLAQKQKDDKSGIDDVVRLLADLSSYYALTRQRDTTWPAPPAPPIVGTDEIRQQIENLMSEAPYSDELRHALDTLLSQVVLERAGTATSTLAGDVLDNQREFDITQDSPSPLLQALAVVSAISSLS